MSILSDLRAGLAALDSFEEKVGQQVFICYKKLEDQLAGLVQNFNRRIRKITKTKSSFPTDDSLFKILYLIVMDASGKWTMPIRDWGIILDQLMVYFKERVDVCLYGEKYNEYRKFQQIMLRSLRSTFAQTQYILKYYTAIFPSIFSASPMI